MIKEKTSTGFWLDALEETTLEITLDLDCFVNYADGVALSRFTNINSAYPVRRVKPISGDGYRLIAIGRLTAPFAVWLRQASTNAERQRQYMERLKSRAEITSEKAREIAEKRIIALADELAKQRAHEIAHAGAHKIAKEHADEIYKKTYKEAYDETYQRAYDDAYGAALERTLI